MRLPSRSSGGAGYDIPMTPMIDVVFLLLVYFVWTASFQMAENRLPGAIAPPAASGGAAATTLDVPPPESDFDQLVVRVHWVAGAPRWTINDQSADSLVAVRDALRRIAAIKPDLPVVLHPDTPTPFGHVIDAYDAARQAGFPQVRFAAPRSERS